MPHAVMKLLEVTNNERTTASDIEKIVFEDQALAARLLAITNSAAFGLPGRVDSVARAVVILGFQRVRSVAMSLAAMSIFKSKTPRVREEQMLLWRHSFGTAAAAKAIARHRAFSAEDAELAYLGGLMHDLGKLFLLTYFEAPYFAIKERAKSSLEEAKFEVGVFGNDHSTIGMQLSKSWNFPLSLVHTIGKHEGPFQGVWSPGIFAVHTASRLSHWVTFNSEEGEPEVDPVAWNWLEPNESIMAGFVSIVREAASGVDLKTVL
ncbi:MAG: hypothetical protein HONBIEJF_02845 [Fimbriimonadaceae bacterium]|nr:hypothetical protein [Fimbriimonadaceae bacterium]